MNNIYDLDKIRQLAANENVEIPDPDTSETLNSLRESSSEIISQVLESNQSLANLNQQTQEASQEITRLDTEITASETGLKQRFQATFPAFSDQQLNWAIDYIKRFNDINSIKHNLQQEEHFPGISLESVNDLIDQLDQEGLISNLQNQYEAISSNSNILLDAFQELAESNLDKIGIHFLRTNFIRTTGIYLNPDLTGKVEIAHTTQAGEERYITLDILSVSKNGNYPFFEVKYTDPDSETEVITFLKASALRNILFTSKALSTQAISMGNINKMHGLEPLDLSYKVNEPIEFISADGTLSEISITNQSNQGVTLSRSVYVNGENKSDLSYQEFSKWALLHNGMPKMTASELNAALVSLPVLYKQNLNTDLPEISDSFSISVGTKLKSMTDESEIEVLEVNENQISYNYNGSPIQKSNSQFLKFLSDNNYYPPETPEAVTPPNPESGSDDPDDNDKKESSGYVFGGTPAILKPGTYTGALSWVATLGGNIVWLSYDDVAKTIIPKIVDNIKSGLEISNKRKLGENFKDTPYIGEEFARMNSAAKGELVEDYKKGLDRIGDWKQVRSIIFNTTNIFQFIAATNFLKEKGYLPTYDARYLKNVQKFSKNQLGKPFDIPDNIQKNRSIVDKNLISFYDDLLDPGEGVTTINSNKSNKESAVQEYKRQSTEIFSENTEWGLTRLHRILEDFSNGNDVDPHEYEGYLLGAYDSGEVNEVEMITYLALGATVKDKNGDNLVKGYEGLLVPIKKEFIALNMFLDGTKGDIYSFFQKEILSNGGSVPSAAKGSDKASIEERFGSEKAAKIKSYVYWTSLSKTVSKKQNSYLKERQISKDFAGHSVFTQDYKNMKNEFVFIPPTSSSSLTAEQVSHGLKTFPDLIKSYSNVLSEGSQNYISDPNAYPEFEAKIKNVIFTYLLVESAYTGRVEAKKGAKAGGAISQDDLNGTSGKRGESEKLIRSLFNNISGVSQSEVDQIFEEYSATGKKHDKYLENLEKLMSKVSSKQIIEALKNIKTS